ncbi:1-acyl-sn-glycerol-3-phosphate acyltransferase [Tindallia magadiensis]|uniref:1-acyl-sn-glycerol-3-phosphate acyltransferase n=1 Tax=Tindallia magadiensis TaxID=69895 RepID=A0A1I3AWQ4_9FIRM|nr:lysophospholipid acyltransferase family protein [Tindallia magadiensis]SFH54548.1 1-acyl-sn-glycerol-3-phosphate acyltransferase [Tindallia magadiensis]
MLRTAYWLFDFLFYLLYIIFCASRAKSMEKNGDKLKKRAFTQKVGQVWSHRIIKKSGSKITIEGAENIPESGPVLIVSNHQSYFDIPLLVSTIPLPMGFVAKKELQKIPVISKWMDLIECSFIDRKDLRQSIKAIQKAQHTLKDGHSMVIFPEGTRSKRKEMSSFKPGSLKLAQKAGVPILPVAIQGTCDMFETNNRIYPADVKIKILPLFDLEYVENTTTNQLLTDVFQLINKELGGSSLLSID